MSADNSFTPGDDDAVERFATAVDGRGEGAVYPELARELAIVDRLVAQGANLDPDPEARTRARHRLMAALADDLPRVAGDGPSRAS